MRTPHDELAHCLYAARYWLDRYYSLSLVYPDQIPDLAAADLRTMESRIQLLREEAEEEKRDAA